MLYEEIYASHRLGVTIEDGRRCERIETLVRLWKGHFALIVFNTEGETLSDVRFSCLWQAWLEYNGGTFEKGRAL